MQKDEPGANALHLFSKATRQPMRFLHLNF